MSLLPRPEQKHEYDVDSSRNHGMGSADPKLKRRLKRVNIPVLVAWGESDRLFDSAYGHAYAEAFPNAHFELIAEAGHLPQIEQPERLLPLVRKFAISTPKGS